MWLWLRETIRSGPVTYLSDLTWFLLAFYCPLAIFFQYSRRIHARLEALAPRRSPPSNVFTRNMIKLKLVPDADTGQRMNFLLSLYVALLVANFAPRMGANLRYNSLIILRKTLTTQDPVQLSKVWLIFVIPTRKFLRIHIRVSINLKT